MQKLFLAARDTQDAHVQHRRRREVVMTDDGPQPPMKQPTTAVHRTRVVVLTAACTVGRGCNVVRGLCIVFVVYNRCLVCARGKKHKHIGNRKSIGVLMCNPNGVYISAQS